MPSIRPLAQARQFVSDAVAHAARNSEIAVEEDRPRMCTILTIEGRKYIVFTEPDPQAKLA